MLDRVSVYDSESYKSDKHIGSPKTEISDIDKPPKLISDSIDHLSLLVALLSLGKTDAASELAHRFLLRLYESRLPWIMHKQLGIDQTAFLKNSYCP